MEWKKIIETWQQCPIHDEKTQKECKLELEGLKRISNRVHGIVVTGEYAAKELEKLERLEKLKKK